MSKIFDFAVNMARARADAIAVEKAFKGKKFKTGTELDKAFEDILETHARNEAFEELFQVLPNYEQEGE